MMEQLMKMASAMEVVYPYVKHIENEAMFSAFVGTLIDQWIADHGFEWDKGGEILLNILAVRGDAFEMVGEAEAIA